MAKTYNNLYPEICSLENLYLAERKARRGKSRKQYVEDFGLHRERFIHQLHEELLSGSYRPRGYKHFYIHDPKKRLISAAPFRDRVVHHALCNVLEPVLERSFVYDSYSCQKGKGTTAARERCRKKMNRYRYVLKCDVRKFFPSIDHEVLKEKLAKKVRCKFTLQLCHLIIDSYLDEEFSPVFFPGDDLFSATRKRGLPIGNLTSQLWANFYLDRIDHFILEELKPKGYARYTDDWLLWADDKAFLSDCREQIEMELRKERLILQARKTRVFQSLDGVSFLGFFFRQDRSPRLAGNTKRRFEKRTRRQMKQLHEKTIQASDITRSVFGWMQFAKYGEVGHLLNHYYAKGFG
jgi:retron-type reverse transcriptase